MLFFKNVNWVLSKDFNQWTFMAITQIMRLVALSFAILFILA